MMMMLFLEQEQHKVSGGIQIEKSSNKELVTRQLFLPGMLNALRRYSQFFQNIFPW